MVEVANLLLGGDWSSQVAEERRLRVPCSELKDVRLAEQRDLS